MNVWNVCISQSAERKKHEDRCAGRRGRSHPELRTRPRPARSTPWLSAASAAAAEASTAPPGDDERRLSSLSPFSPTLASPGPVAGLAWGEDAVEDQAAAEGKAPPQRSEDGVGAWGAGRREGLVGLSGVCRVRGAVGWQSSQSALCGPFLVGYDEICFPFLMASLLALTHLLPRIVSMWRAVVIPNSIESHIVRWTRRRVPWEPFVNSKLLVLLLDSLFKKRNSWELLQKAEAILNGGQWSSWRRKRHHTQLLWPGKSHGQRSLVPASVHGVAKSRTRLSDFTLMEPWLELGGHRVVKC